MNRIMFGMRVSLEETSEGIVQDILDDYPLHINEATILKTNSGGIEPCLVDYDGDVREVQCTTKCEINLGCPHAVPHEVMETCRTSVFGWRCQCH
jgi:hypothetical protein